MLKILPIAYLINTAQFSVGKLTVIYMILIIFIRQTQTFRSLV